MNPGLFDFVIGIVALPFQLIQDVVFAAMDFVVFTVLRLGPYLPLHLGS